MFYLILPRCIFRNFYVGGVCQQEESHNELKSLPSRAQIVVCGGGIVGSSVVFHLPKFGFKDIVHLEQGRFVFTLYCYVHVLSIIISKCFRSEV